SLAASTASGVPARLRMKASTSGRIFSCVEVLASLRRSCNSLSVGMGASAARGEAARPRQSARRGRASSPRRTRAPRQVRGRAVMEAPARENRILQKNKLMIPAFCSQYQSAVDSEADEALNRAGQLPKGVGPWTLAGGGGYTPRKAAPCVSNLRNGLLGAGK